MQIFTTAVLLSGLTSLVAGAAFGPPGGFPGGFKFTPPTTTHAVTSTAPAYTTTTSAPAYTSPTSTYTYTSPISTPTNTVSPSVTCLTNSTAAYLVNGFASLLTAYNNNTANAILASDFTDTSDSINFLIGAPLGTTTFPSKAAFEGGQGIQPSIGFSILSIDFGCTFAAFRWVATVGLQIDPVKGINVLYASNLNGTAAGWQIESMYSEFNVGAWEVDIGKTCG